MFARLARILALLLAFQAVVAQAHMHGAVGGVRPVATSAQVDARTAPAPHRSDEPLDCPVCRTLAHVDAYVSPGPLAFTAPAPVAAWSPVATPPIQLRGQRSHDWRSRAPPVLLHA